MTEIVQKIHNGISDFWLDLQLRMGRTGGKSESPAIERANVSPPKMGGMRVSSKGRLFFYDQMGTLIDSGVPAIDSLILIRLQESSKKLRKLYGEMIHHINAGMSLSDSMDLFPHVFPPMQVALIRAGEKSGNLKLVLSELVSEMESSDDFFRKIKGAMFYPLILITLSLILVVGMMTFIIPKISQMYAESDVPLPQLTQNVINISDFMLRNWKILFPSVIGLVMLTSFFFTKVRSGRILLEKIIFATPLIGKINRQKNTMIICENMGMLLKSGVLISEAFSITEETLENLHYRKELGRIRQGVIMGREMSAMIGLEDLHNEKFRKNDFFPLQVAQMIRIGESTGTIPKMLYKIRDNYYKNIQYTLKNISTVIEPVMIFIMAALVGSILMAVMLPFFYIGTTIS